MTSAPAFDRAVALMCARASAAAYELDDGKRRAMLAAAALHELGFIQARSDARLLVAETMAGEVLWSFQGTQFTKAELPIILENLKTGPVCLGLDNAPVRDGDTRAITGWPRVMAGDWDQLQALVPHLDGVPEPSIITGHSLGGSVANLAANTLPFARAPRLVTFAAPRCADAAFWARARVLPMRIEREDDPGPRWPITGPWIQPPGVWWLHAGTVTFCDHRPTLVDMVTGWPQHSITDGYVPDLEALP